MSKSALLAAFCQGSPDVYCCSGFTDGLKLMAQRESVTLVSGDDLLQVR